MQTTHRRESIVKQCALLLVVTVVMTGSLASRARATVPTFFVVQKDARFLQTGPSTTVGDGFDFIGKAQPNDGVSPIAYDGGTLSFPAASALSTAPLGPSGVSLQYASGKVAQSTFQADYPNGTFTFHMTNSGNASLTQTEAVDNSTVPVPTSDPMLSAASFNALQGMDPTKALTVSFNAFTGANANALIFFAIQDSSGHSLIFDGLQPNVTQDTIAAGTLQAGAQYSFVLFFSNVAITPDNNGEVLMDTRTTGSFSTVPEPTTGLSFALAGVLLLLRRRMA
jgi:hypothetical protein